MIDFLLYIKDIIWILLVPILLLVGVFFTFRTSFVQILNFPSMIKAITSTKDTKGGLSGIQTFFIGMASRVGTGNIAGVAVAISVGGAGSVFWMWIVAILGSASAFIESTLAQLYKVRDEEVKFRGGPAYYISRGLNNKPLAIAFAVSISISFGLVFNALQANTISTSLNTFFDSTSYFVTPLGNSGITPLSIIIAVLLASLVAFILFSGSKRIADISSVVVPVMAIIYVLLALFVIITNFSQIDDVFILIFTSAFSQQALAGGLSGVVIQQGVKRGLFSNEAGMGSAPNAAASADANHPASQGLIQAFGVFIDTIVICSATAFIILLPKTVNPSLVIPEGMDGINITQTALGMSLGQWAIIFLTIAIFFFAFSSILGNYFYSQSNIEFINDKKSVLNTYKLIVVLMVVFGSLAGSQTVWDLADLFMGIMALINIYAIVALHPKAILLLRDYRKQLKEHKKPKFNSKDHEDFESFEIWSQE